MKKLSLALFAAVLALSAPLVASAAPTHGMTDQAKKDFTVGAFQVPASACTGSQAPSPCCSAASTGANCPTYKLGLITSTSTAGTGTTTWASISSNEVGASGSYSAGGATLAGYTVSVASNHSCVTFTSPVSFTSATITAQAAVVYCSANCPTLDVVGILCLDGTTGTCSANTSSTSGTFSVTLPAGGTFCLN
jgi:hypothetical protein